MSSDVVQNREQRSNRNQSYDVDVTVGKNATDGIFLIPEYFNVTSLDINATEEIDSFYFYETEQFTVLWLLFVVIVAGNTAVLAGLLLGKRRKSRMDFFIKQLAFADLLVGLISVLTDIIWRTTVTWHAGNIACKLIRFMQAVVTYSSTYVLVALSIDRYDAITRPMNFSGSWWRARVLVVVAWSLSALFSIPIIFLIIAVFILCWSPYIIFDLLQVYGHVPKTQTNIAVATFIQSLAPLNSAANPIIYCLFSTPFFN